MVALPDQTLPTILAIFKHYEDAATDYRRPHLGASIIGHQCERKLFYDFRWCTNPKPEGRLLRLFESGNQQEPRIVKDLRDIGVTVYDRDPDTGEQIHYEMFGGHFAGSLDAMAQGFVESSMWHVVEIKTHGLKSFKTLEKSGVQITKPEHYAQMNIYMHWAGVERAYYFAVCKDSDAIYGERIPINKELCRRLINKAERIVFSDVALFPISDSDGSPACRFCIHKNVCRGISLPEVNCRTCARVTPEQNGTWSCKGRVLCLDEQKAIHDCHVFNPSLTGKEPTDSDPEKGTISYGNVVNGPGEIPSTELQEVFDKVASGEIEI